MNFYDSERMADVLVRAGLSPSDGLENADMVLLNTCHIREKAAEKIYSELGRIVPLKARKQNMVIGVAGCVAQAEGQEILNRAPGVDMVFGPQNFHNLPVLLDELMAARQTKQKHAQVLRLDFPVDEKFTALNVPSPNTPSPYTPSPYKNAPAIVARRPTAFLTIQEGCDKFCTFCVVPYTRGGEVSRPMADIIAEAHRLADVGVCEITLLGQNVNAWACPKTGARLADLLAALATITALHRLRFTTSHPSDMDDALITAFASNEKLMPYLHLPVQSGSDAVLRAMNRKHSIADYVDIIARVRNARPDIALSSDFIVGFPGESDGDFEATLDLVARIGFAQAFSFKYSPRPGTPAAEHAAQLDEEVKTRRLHQLQAQLKAQHRDFNGAQIGRTLPVLFEKTPAAAPKYAHQISGRSPYLQPVHVSLAAHKTHRKLDDQDKTAFYGRILPVRIEAAGDNSLQGVLAAPA